MKKFFLAAALLALTGCGGGEPQVSIAFAVADNALRKPGAACSGAGGYVAVHRGAPFAVLDAATGETLADGALPSGVARRIGEPIAGAAVEPTACVMAFSVRLPDRGVYTFRVGAFRRTAVPTGHTLSIRLP